MLSLYARARGEVAVCGQVIDAGMLDDRTGSSTESYPCADSLLWPPATNRYCWQAYLGGASSPPGAVPAREANLGKLPPACIVVGSLDLLFAENLEYARRLVRAGVPTELHVIAGAFHGFSVGAQDAPQVKMLHQFKRDALSRVFRTSP
jgi:acetyl esterase/lipase